MKTSFFKHFLRDSGTNHHANARRAVNGGRHNRVFRATQRRRTVGKSTEGEVKKQSAVTERRGNEET